MIKKYQFFIAFFITFFPSLLLASVYLSDNFSDSSVDVKKWHYPYWGGYRLGRTIFKDDGYPETKNGNVIISVESYNPQDDLKSTFYGTSLVSNDYFYSENSYVHVKVRAKMSIDTPGIVCGIFMFSFRDRSENLHDEIDFEIVTSEPDAVMTNVYKNEPLGAGYPEFYVYDSGTITDFHIYEIIWEKNKVSWIVDGNIVRIETEKVPEIPMELHLNAWAADSEWTQAYNPYLNPAESLINNQKIDMIIDYVEIKTSFNLSPILYLLKMKQ